MPLSPPPSYGGEIIHHGLHQIIQNNSNNAYAQDQYGEGVHLLSNSGLPGPAHRGLQPIFEYQRQHQDPGLGIHYDRYNADYQRSIYPDQYTTPAKSQLTSPLQAGTMMTRSGVGVRRSGSNQKPAPERARASKPPKLAKAKKEKSKKEKKVAKIDKPLSELTKNWKHVAMADIEGYVNRSAEERQKEVQEGKIPGKVKRPMNSFMLYRKAYQNRTKDWCLQNNHQVVSQVCGDSWPLEPEHIKEQFSEWARIERVNHQNAHPGYKFSPTKPGSIKATKRKVAEELMSDESDLEDFDWQGAKTRKSKKSRLNPTPAQPVAYPSTMSAYQYSSRDNSTEPNNGDYNKSSYHATNPGRPLPPPYNQEILHAGQYYQQVIQNNPNIAGVEDVILKKTTMPGMYSYLGLPGGQEYDMMNQYQPYEASPGPEHKIDPSLMAQDQEMYNPGNNDPNQESGYFGESHNDDWQWQSPYSMNDRDVNYHSLPYVNEEQSLNSFQIPDHHMHVLRGNQDGWQVESLDSGQEFELWMDGEWHDRDW